MLNFNPYGDQFRALEKNIVRYRSLEALVVIFYTEAIKSIALKSFQVTEKMFQESPRINQESKNKYKTLWRILLEENVITIDDKKDLDALLEFRNNSAHSLPDLFSDLNNDDFSGEGKYVRNTASLAKELYKKITDSLSEKYVIYLTMDRYIFRNVEKTYWNDMSKLSTRINKLIAERNKEIDSLKKEYDRFNEEHLSLFHPHHPENRKPNNHISEIGLRKIKQLMDLGYSDLAVSSLMNINLVTIKRYRKKFGILPVKLPCTC